MASYKPLIVSLLLLSITCALFVNVLRADDLSMFEVDTSLLKTTDIDCESACNARCSESSRVKICKRACGACCARCRCVPPGTSGNEDVCPCYANKTTHGGRHKCP